MKEINIAEIIASMRHGKPLPTFASRLVERLIHQNEINYVLRTYGHLEGGDFLDALMEYFRIDVEWVNKDNLPTDGRKIFACNHPLGGLDGICLSHALYHQYGDVRYIVNDMLYHLEPLRSVFLPVNKYGSQHRESILKMQEVLASDTSLGTFPAGLCSRYINGRIQDLDWKKSFVQHAIQYERDIVPLCFDGLNSRHFYMLEYLRKKVGLKFNVGTVLLPDEMFKSKGKRYRVMVGKPISWQSLKESKRKPQELAAEIRILVHNMSRK